MLLCSSIRLSVVTKRPHANMELARVGQCYGVSWCTSSLNTVLYDLKSSRGSSQFEDSCLFGFAINRKLRPCLAEDCSCQSQNVLYLHCSLKGKCWGQNLIQGDFFYWSPNPTKKRMTKEELASFGSQSRVATYKILFRKSEKYVYDEKGFGNDK